MRFNIRIFVAASSIALVCSTFFLIPRLALAEYPQKPVNFVVQWAPSSQEDAVLRMIAEDFEAAYGTPAAVVNKSEFGFGVSDAAAKPADGYTVGSLVIGMPANGEVTTLGLVPDIFEPLGIFLTYPFVLVAANEAPYFNITALTEHAMDNDVVFGHGGRSLVPTKAAIAYAKNAGFEWASELELDKADCDALASGKADVISTTLQLVMPCIDDIKVLASITVSRNSAIPDVPTLGELDPTLVLGFWNGLFVHKDTPAEVREKIIDVAKSTVTSSKVQALIEDSGAIVYWQDAEQASRRIVVDRGTLLELDKIVQY